jgi:hypothetical protein
MIALRTMTKNARTVSLVAIGAVVLVVLVLSGRDMFQARQQSRDCGDGPRHVIDIRDFTTQYSAYSVELEANIGDKGKVSTKLNPGQLQQVSEAMQSAREFRKYVVAGYNSCGITKTEYGQYGARFQALDTLAREINELVSRAPLSQEETKRLADLIKQYGDMVKSLGS